MMKFDFIKKLLPPDNKVFFDCFIEAANICKKSAILYNRYSLDWVNAQEKYFWIEN